MTEYTSISCSKDSYKVLALRVAWCSLSDEVNSSLLPLVWSKISNVLKRLGFRSRDFFPQLLSEISRACTIRVRRSSLRRLWKIWARMLAYITGTVDQELLLRNEYLAAVLRAQIKGRLLLSDAEKATLAEIAHRLKPQALDKQSRCHPRNSGPVQAAIRS